MKRLNTGTSFGTVTIDVHRSPSGVVAPLARDTELRLVVVMNGDVLLRGGSYEIPLSRGEAALLGVGVTCDLATPSGGSVTVIKGPGELAQDTPASFWGASPILLSDVALVRPIVAFALQLVAKDAVSPTRLGGYYIERLLQEMLQGVLAELSTGESVLPQVHDPYQRALATLAAQHADLGLTSDAVAESVNLSRRQLEREFARRGTTIRNELRRIRLDRAREMLTDPGYAMLGVDQIAHHVGFSGASSLGRAMAQAGYGRPSSMRP